MDLLRREVQPIPDLSPQHFPFLWPGNGKGPEPGSGWAIVGSSDHMESKELHKARCRGQSPGTVLWPTCGTISDCTAYSLVQFCGGLMGEQQQLDKEPVQRGPQWETLNEPGLETCKLLFAWLESGLDRAPQALSLKCPDSRLDSPRDPNIYHYCSLWTVTD